MKQYTSRRLLKKQHLSPVALGLAILLHGVLFGIMFIKVDSHMKPVAAVKALQVKAEKPVDIIEASTVESKDLEKIKEKKKEKEKAIEREKQRKIAVEKKRVAEAKRKKEEKIKKAEAEKKRKKEVEKKAALKKKKESEEKAHKKAEAKKKKAAEKKKKLAEEKKRKVAAEKKRKAEASRKRKEADMKKQMEVKARAARAGQAMSKYVPRIQQKVETNWNYPPRGPEGCNPTVRVNLAPDGKVLSARIVKSSGDSFCDRSVEQAFMRASPIPIPLDPDLYSEFKVIDFPFRP
ncbi:MAG: cell envelope integrity protein TolA [Deltaproteobacteria bacterium]|nr:cell envelope integrity protein TolA [Deltaproteobacteria bacterium]